MSWAHLDSAGEDVEANVRLAHADFLARRDLRLHLYLRDGGALVGASGLHRIGWTVPRFETGYWVRTSMAGRGYATEATRRIADFAFTDLGAERVEIWCDARNERSAAVATRAGFTLEARLNRNRRDTGGELSDSLCFVRLRQSLRLLPPFGTMPAWRGIGRQIRGVPSQLHAWCEPVGGCFPRQCSRGRAMFQTGSRFWSIAYQALIGRTSNRLQQ